MSEESSKIHRVSNATRMGTVERISVLQWLIFAVVFLVEFVALQKIAGGDVALQGLAAVLSIIVASSRPILEFSRQRAAMQQDYETFKTAGFLLNASVVFFILSVASVSISHGQAIMEKSAAASKPAQLAELQIESAQNELREFNAQNPNRSEIEMTAAKLSALESDKQRLIASHNSSFSQQNAQWESQLNDFWNKRTKGVIHSSIMNDDCTPKSDAKGIPFKELAKQVCPQLQSLIDSKPNSSQIAGVKEIELQIEKSRNAEIILTRFKFLEEQQKIAIANYQAVLSNTEAINGGLGGFGEMSKLVQEIFGVLIPAHILLGMFAGAFGWWLLSTALLSGTVENKLTGKLKPNQSESIAAAEEITHKESLGVRMVNAVGEWVRQKRDERKSRTAPNIAPAVASANVQTVATGVGKKHRGNKVGSNNDRQIGFLYNQK